MAEVSTPGPCCPSRGQSFVYTARHGERTAGRDMNTFTAGTEGELGASLQAPPGEAVLGRMPGSLSGTQTHCSSRPPGPRVDRLVGECCLMTLISD